MPINSLEYTTLMQPKLDEQIVQEATSGWMEANSGQVQYNGGKTIKLPRLSTTGMANYDRDNGFNKQGSVTLVYDPYTMTMDRMGTFQLDSMDVNETNFVANSAAVIRTFQRDHVIPEIDAYRYASLNAKAAEATNTEALAITADNVLGKIREHARAVRDYVGQDAPLICSITSTALGMLEDSPSITKTMTVSDFAQGSIKLRVKEMDGIIFRVVPAARLKTAFVYHDGATQFGFAPDETAKDIHWIMCPQNVPIAVSKTDKLRVFEPDTNQKADAWKIDYRKYHDLWVLKSKEKAVFSCTAP